MDRRGFIGAAAGAVAAMQLPAMAGEVEEPVGQTLLQHILAGTDPASSLRVTFETSDGPLTSTGEMHEASECRFKEISVKSELEVTGYEIHDGARRLVGKEGYAAPRMLKAGEALTVSLFFATA